MKRVVIGIAVLATLVLYSLGVRHEQPRVSTPSPLATRDTPTGNSTSGTATNSNGTYKDGTYTGSTEDAFYGNVQVRVLIDGGKLASVTFLQYPNTHSTSVYINRQAMPYLQREAIQAQSAQVDIVSGATYTSQAFIRSLHSALGQAA